MSFEHLQGQWYIPAAKGIKKAHTKPRSHKGNKEKKSLQQKIEYCGDFNKM